MANLWDQINQVDWSETENASTASALVYRSLEYFRRVEAHIYQGNEIRNDEFMDFAEKQDAVSALDRKRTRAHNELLEVFEKFTDILKAGTDFENSHYRIENRTQKADLVAMMIIELIHQKPASHIDGAARDEIVEKLHSGELSYSQAEDLLKSALKVNGQPGIGKKATIGIAWHDDPQETYFDACRAIEAAGADVVRLGQVFSEILDYDDNGRLRGCLDKDGALTPETAKAVIRTTWKKSNAGEIMKGIDAVVFPGGGDISPSLFRDPEPVRTVEGFIAERDVSDYILMSYCLDKDIPLLGICRGMQVLAVVSGAGMIQDISDHMKSLGKEYKDQHRDEPAGSGEARKYVFHDVIVRGEESILYRLTGTDRVISVPSWHHQAVGSTDNTELLVSGVSETCGEELAEVIERPDRHFVLGLQFHPESAAVHGHDDISPRYFSALVDAAAGRLQM